MVSQYDATNNMYMYVNNDTSTLYLIGVQKNDLVINIHGGVMMYGRKSYNDRLQVLTAHKNILEYIQDSKAHIAQDVSEIITRLGIEMNPIREFHTKYIIEYKVRVDFYTLCIPRFRMERRYSNFWIGP